MGKKRRIKKKLVLSVKCRHGYNLPLTIGHQTPEIRDCRSQEKPLNSRRSDAVLRSSSDMEDLVPRFTSKHPWRVTFLNLIFHSGIVYLQWCINMRPWRPRRFPQFQGQDHASFRPPCRVCWGFLCDCITFQLLPSPILLPFLPFAYTGVDTQSSP